jgi:hypothetical protein
MPARMAMMAITTSSSISVKPLREAVVDTFDLAFAVVMMVLQLLQFEPMADASSGTSFLSWS